MFIELENLFNGGETRIPLECSFDFSSEEIDGVFPFTSPVTLKGKITNIAELVSINAVARVHMETFCSRCAEDVTLDFDVPIEHGLVRELENPEECDEYILLEDMRLDLEALTLEDIYFALPSKILCSETCKGLCQKCGANLNLGPCSCEKDIDPRLEALLGLM